MVLTLHLQYQIKSGEQILCNNYKQHITYSYCLIVPIIRRVKYQLTLKCINGHCVVGPYEFSCFLGGSGTGPLTHDVIQGVYKREHKVF